MTEKIISFLKQAAETLFHAIDIQATTLHHQIIVPNHEQNGRWFKDSTTGQPTLRGFDVDINDGEQKETLRLLEQNPNKRDANGNLTQMANLASQGDQIMWVIDRAVKINAFLGRVENGVFIPQTARVASPASINLNDIPTLPNSQNIPDYVNSTLNTYEHEIGWEEDSMDVEY